MAKAKIKIAYVCSDCGADFTKWQGQCSECKAWNTITEFREAAVSSTSRSLNAAISRTKNTSYTGINSQGVQRMDSVKIEQAARVSTGLSELDRVLGGGITLGSVVLISGDPGSGKTTLLTKVAQIMSQTMVTLYVTAEESLSQWAKRATERLKLNFNELNFLLSDTDCIEDIVNQCLDNNVRFLIADSIQAFESNSVDGTAGGITQVKTCAKILNRLCKQHGITLILVGQVNKNSQMAGPQTLKHIIDTAIHIEVNDASVRILRADKNRFGDTEQVGIFQMTEFGMHSVDNPSRLFLSGSEEHFEGSAIAVIKDGSRNLLIEIQALATDVEGEKSIRNCIGVSYSRLSLITAVLKKHGGISTYYDINISLVGGLKMADSETSTDMAVTAALLSSINSKPLPEDAVFIGELALTGELRQIPQIVPRVREALSHGIKHIFIPAVAYHKSMQQYVKAGQSIHPLKDIKALIEALN
ncbi:DNA repair protein RadA [Psychromonas sp. CNPT3]|uniref:DNA repair protein RadA n=1 Tax=Psychromonas sp. CNPT3 TaxID=314282 RepID=UPI00006E423C|nr:DNA repair protein RadA [Psychromonas sp. CNPT3]AGH81098.1 DNA repair protein RadA [Psychromonas sp. CNPT3]